MNTKDNGEGEKGKNDSRPSERQGEREGQGIMHRNQGVKGKENKSKYLKYEELRENMTRKMEEIRRENISKKRFESVVWLATTTKKNFLWQILPKRWN